MARGLKIGVAVNPDALLAYESCMLKTLLAMPNIDCQFMQNTEKNQPGQPTSQPGYRLYEMLDNAILGSGDDPFETQPLDLSVRGKTLHHDPKPDFIIALHSQLSFARQQPSSEFGILYLDCIDSAGRSLSPPGYWEVMQFTTDSILAVKLLSPDGQCQTISQTHSATTEVSRRQNVERIFWKAPSIVSSILRQLDNESISHAIGLLIDKQTSSQYLSCFKPPSQSQTLDFGQNPLNLLVPGYANSAVALPAESAGCLTQEKSLRSRQSTQGLDARCKTGKPLITNNSEALENVGGVPDNLTLVKHLWQKIPGFFRFYLQSKLYWDQWFLLFNLSPDPSTDIHAFTPIYPPKDRIWADPHIFIHDGKFFVFIEEMRFKEDKGYISVFEIFDDGFHSKPFKVLEEDFHLSYPQVFEWQGQIWMIPESSENKTISLYRCKHFPDQWEKHSDLLVNIDAVDTSILFDQDKCWLFCSVRPHPDASENDELHIYFSNDLVSGEWTAHPQNPVISDVRRARPAGKIYRQSGRLMRPSQNCSKIYGYGFNLNAISKLNENEYQESPVTCVTADQFKDTIGIHTYARENQLTVVDACRRYSKLFLLK